jgi:hypothetical protein
MIFKCKLIDAPRGIRYTVVSGGRKRWEVRDGDRISISPEDAHLMDHGDMGGWINEPDWNAKGYWLSTTIFELSCNDTLTNAEKLLKCGYINEAKDMIATVMTEINNTPTAL